MTCAVPHTIPHLRNRQLLPQTGNLNLHREVVRNSKAEGLVIRPNHYEFDDEHGRTQANREVEEHACCEGRCNTHCPHKKNIGEPYYPLEGNTKEHNSKAGKMLDGLPMSLGQAQHE